MSKAEKAGLDRYRARRVRGRTPEPFSDDNPADPSQPPAASAEGTPPAAGQTPGRTASAPRLFVIQKHAARRLHYDLRLEWNGALHSWAVPNGIPLSTSEKRMAVEVEDHPIEYADFEGVIPKGNYGAGAAIVWDRGHWVAREGPGEGIESGKLHFDLHGHKLHGTWILVRTKGDPKQWLLMRKLERGEPEGPPPGEESILSGLTVEELAEGRDRAVEIRRDLQRSGAGRGALDPGEFGLMLAEVARKPFSSPGWIFEIKYDGYRALASLMEGEEPHLRSRGGQEMAGTFPEIARALDALPYRGFVLDGELVVFDQDGRTGFNALQLRAGARPGIAAQRAARETPATFVVFDLLALEGFDLRKLPLLERKAFLRRILPRAGLLRYCDHIEEQGAEMFEQVRRLGLEGVLAKDASAPYSAGRSASWRKFVAHREGDFVVVGYTARGSGDFGALHLAGRSTEAAGSPGNGWTYAGRVGTGFSEAERSEILGLLRPRRVPPCEIPAGLREPSSRWTEPEVVVSVRYRSRTGRGMLRAPVFLRLRRDKTPEQCDFGIAAETPDPPTTEGTHPQGRRSPKLSLTHLEKVYWPDDGLTKGDLIDYYRAVSGRMLPYLKDRPVVLTRYPEGIHGQSFFQKRAPEHAADWVRTVTIAHSDREIAYFLCQDRESLLYLANLGSIPIHVWSSRASSLDHPDWCILDLDPKGAPFAHVVRLARAIHDLCTEIGLPSFAKTSGSTGLHVLLPLPDGCSYEESRILAQLLCAVIEGQYPKIATTVRNIDARGGRVYLDALQNRRGQLLVAPYSVRPLPGAPVSAPLEWTEVDDALGPRTFHIRNMTARLRGQAADPMAPLLTTAPDLLKALKTLESRLR